jgi:hypothetical protein
VQLIVPFRHWLYPGDASWTEEGHLFAWRMKLRDKRGRVIFWLTDPVSGTIWRHDPRQQLPRWQADVMAYSPDLILQYSHFLADHMRRRGYAEIQVRVRAVQSLNGRQPQLFINPRIDLATEQRSIRHAAWIMPLVEPLPAERPWLAKSSRPASRPLRPAGVTATSAH